jgi:predicted benzoate:H+ symporter BenE
VSIVASAGDIERLRAAIAAHAGVGGFERVDGEDGLAMLTAFPKELIAAIAGLALLGTIGNALHVALVDEAHREAALITFLVTLSGVVIAGVGAAFWGVVAGALTLFVQQYRRARV